MLTLDLSRAPRWLDLGHGVWVQVVPLTTQLMVDARDHPAVAGLPEDASEPAVALAMAKAVARMAILDWDGVGDADGKPLPVSEDAIDALLDLFPIFEAFQLQYVSKGLLMEQEKNGSAPSPTGTSAGARTTAPPAPGGAPSARGTSTGR